MTQEQILLHAFYVEWKNRMTYLIKGILEKYQEETGHRIVVYIFPFVGWQKNYG